MLFEKHNMNPFNRKTGDCVCRAIAAATGRTWFEVFDDLTAFGRERGEWPNYRTCYWPYLESIGWVRHKRPPVRHGRRLRVRDLDVDTAIITCRHHLTVVKNGVVYDLWDTRNEVVNSYWTKSK